MKYASKKLFIDAIEREHDLLCAIVATIPLARRRVAGVWGSGWNVQDLLAHLTEWEQMFLGWHEAGRRGESPQMPAAGYKWSEAPKLNEAIWRKHRRKSFAAVSAAFAASYEQVLALLKEMTADELLCPGRFAWTGRNPLVTYAAANTASHYRTATKILKRWLRGHVREVKPARRVRREP
ncbi:MAG: ClbS/DfsB family four-helix bundle protein [Planctomycetota bacterium]